MLNKAELSGEPLIKKAIPINNNTLNVIIKLLSLLKSIGLYFTIFFLQSIKCKETIPKYARTKTFKEKIKWTKKIFSFNN